MATDGCHNSITPKSVEKSDDLLLPGEWAGLCAGLVNNEIYIIIVFLREVPLSMSPIFC